jgi:predicted benzoate:H+ symporter BenE
VVTTVEGNGDLRPSKVLGGGGLDRHDLPGCEFLLPLVLIRVGATKNIVDLFMSFEEVALELLGLLLLINQLDRLENLICKTLESIIVSGLVLSLGVKNANAIQEAFEFTWPGPVLLMAMRSFHRVDRTVRFSLLVVALGARLIHVA